MHRRVLLLVAAGAGVLLLVGSAAAMTVNRPSSHGRVLAAAPFAKAWASVPRTPAARKVKKTMVFGLEQGVTGFNLGDADENAYYAAIVAGYPIIRGTYLVDQNGNYHFDLASKVKATSKYLPSCVTSGSCGREPGVGTNHSRIETFASPGTMTAFGSGRSGSASAR